LGSGLRNFAMTNATSCTQPERCGVAIEAAPVRVHAGRLRLDGIVGQERFVLVDRAASGTPLPRSAHASSRGACSGISSELPIESPTDGAISLHDGLRVTEYGVYGPW
jgi:hypothetical protein